MVSESLGTRRSLAEGAGQCRKDRGRRLHTKWVPHRYIRTDSPMVKPPPTLASRARGALLGLATGNALGVPTETCGTREAILDRFPGGLTEILRQDTADSPYDDDL